jgi:hypothetical protein
LLFVDFSFGNQNALYDNTRPAFNQSTQYEPGNVHSTNFKYCANTPILSIQSFLSLLLSLDMEQNECEHNPKLPKHVEKQVFSTQAHEYDTQMRMSMPSTPLTEVIKLFPAFKIHNSACAATTTEEQ